MEITCCLRAWRAAAAAAQALACGRKADVQRPPLPTFNSFFSD